MWSAVHKEVEIGILKSVVYFHESRFHGKTTDLCSRVAAEEEEYRGLTDTYIAV